MSVRKVFAFSIMGFSVALAVVVGNRMSTEAMAVVIGVVCGVAASIPMSVIIITLSRRGRVPAQDEPALRPTLPVFVVTPAQPARPGPGWQDFGQVYSAPPIPAPREFRIIGDERF